MLTHPANHIFAHTPESLRQWCVERRMPPFRAAQILEWVYQKNTVDPALMTNLSAADRALLVQRIGLIEMESESLDVKIDSPLLDLTDRQVAELAVDMDAPVWSCWWALPASDDLPEARPQRERWGGLLQDLGAQRLLRRAADSTGGAAS